MSESDLRPAQRGDRPIPPPIPRGPAWWEPLLSKWGMLSLLVFLGLVTSMIQSGFEYTGISVPEISEKNRAKLKAVLVTSLEKFYANPENNPAYEELVLAIKRYRASFADSLPGTLQAPSEKLECSGRECAVKEGEKRRAYEALVEDGLRPHASLHRHSPAYRKQHVELIALDRRIPVDWAIKVMTEDRQYMPYEREAEKALLAFNQAVDQAVAQAMRTKLAGFEEKGVYDDWMHKLSAYVEGTQLTRITMYRHTCAEARPGVGREACSAAMADYANIDSANNRNDEPLSKKAEVLKKVVEQRAVPKAFLEERLKNFFSLRKRSY